MQNILLSGMEQAKIQLSPAEMALVCDAEVILTKNRILEKTKTLFEYLQGQMQQAAAFYHPAFGIPPKISRGENYLGLPYLVLDYPRLFTQNNILAIRTFFWWGNFFSSTLQLSGHWYRQLALGLADAYPELVKRQYFVQVGTDPWAHHFGRDNYLPVTYFSAARFKEHLQQRAQIKIAARWPLESWPSAASYLWENWQFLLGLIARLQQEG